MTQALYRYCSAKNNIYHSLCLKTKFLYINNSAQRASTEFKADFAQTEAKDRYSLLEEIAQPGVMHLQIFSTLQYTCHHFHFQPIGSEVDSLAICFTTSDQTPSLLLGMK